MIRTEDSIDIAVSPEECYRLVSDIEAYARLMPDYSNTRVVAREGNSITMEKTASVRGLRFTWTSVGTPEPPDRVRYRWIRGILRGMETIWTVTPAEEGCQLEIVHQIHWPWWLGGNLIARGVIYPLFVHGMAQKTLRLVKQALERGGCEDATQGPDG